MTDLFVSGGPMMWPLTAVAGGLLFRVGRLVLRPRAHPSADGEHAVMDGILFWGGMAFLLGLLGTAAGLVQMASAVAEYGGSVSPALLWDGVAVSLVTLMFGLLIFAFASVSWLLLHRPGRRKAGFCQQP